ncbi:hypothetical protein N8462_00845 [bacterium]|nr:hypothetical protein [bacterium]
MSFFLNKAKTSSLKKSFIVVDDFYENPDYVRDFALRQNFEKHPESHKGDRTEDRFFAPQTKEVFESILGFKIANFYKDTSYCNGVFQFCTARDSLVYHTDGQDWAGAVYLTPNAPYETGTSFYAAKNSRVRHERELTPDTPDPFAWGFYDSTQFDLVDTVGNVYNRLVLWDARLIHAASKYFGQDKESGRLFHLFFFDLAK